MKYQDFRIRIESKTDTGFNVSVESPAGNADEHIVLPFDIDEAMKQFHQMGLVVRGAASRKVEIDGPEPMKPSEFGDQLFRALFTGRVGKMYNAMCRDLQDPEMGLRINLHLNLNDAGVGALAGVPWEFVYDADTMDYLNLSRQTPVIRYLDVQRPNTVQPLTGKLKVLVVMSSPKGEHALDLDKERKLIESIWSGDDNVELTIKENPTPNKLRSWLTNDNYHVLHYMGHGAHDDKTGVGALVLEDDDGNANLLDAETLGTFLRNAPTIRLAFLNACDLAKTGEDTPFSGVANRLVMAGLPAVVAMQFPISDDAAIAFARTFYTRLEKGQPVDEAVAHGRTAILADKPGSMEWGTPVLYMRTPDGRLFERPGVEPPAADPAAAAETAPAPPAPDGSVSVPKKGIGAAAGILVLLAAIAAGAFFMLGGKKVPLDFESEEIQAYIDEPVEVKFIATNNPEGTAHLDQYNVSVAAPNATGLEVSDTDEINGYWRTMITPRETGDYEIIATPVDVNKPDAEPRKKSAKLVVSINPEVQAAYETAMASVSTPAVATEDLIETLTGLEARGLSAEMRSEIEKTRAALEEVVATKTLARSGFASDSSTLAEKIAAYVDWKTQVQATRDFEPTASAYPEVMQELETLAGRMDVAGMTLCTKAPPCSDVSRVASGGRVYTVIEYTPAEKGSKVAVLYHAMPDNEVRKTRQMTLAGNTTHADWSTAPARGSYEVRLYNDAGDLLVSKPLEIY